jgi:retron-type reverse transcriptase
MIEAGLAALSEFRGTKGTSSTEETRRLDQSDGGEKGSLAHRQSYKRKNLEIAWERVKANQGAGGIDGESIETFGEGLEERLARLHEELRTDKYIPQPVRQQRIPKVGKPGEWRVLGIPTIYDRVCQQALLNRLEPIFEPIFDDANFEYRRGRSTKDACARSGRKLKQAENGLSTRI